MKVMNTKAKEIVGGILLGLILLALAILCSGYFVLDSSTKIWKAPNTMAGVFPIAILLVTVFVGMKAKEAKKDTFFYTLLIVLAVPALGYLLSMFLKVLPVYFLASPISSLIMCIKKTNLNANATWLYWGYLAYYVVALLLGFLFYRRKEPEKKNNTTKKN